MVHRRVDERTGTKSLTPKSTTLNFEISLQGKLLDSVGMRKMENVFNVLK